MLKILFLLFFTLPSWGATDICDIIKASSCTAVTRQFRRSSAQSLPNLSSATGLNPSSVSVDRGIGIETIYNANNPLTIGLAAGTGKTGAALISSTMENSFFGNRVPETSENYLERNQGKINYRSKKLNLAAGASLIKKKNVGFDIGLMAKRHSDIKKVNPGAGLSLRLGPFTAGSSFYKDDYILIQGNEEDRVSDSFTVQSQFIGLRILNLSLDAGVISPKFKDYSGPFNIRIYSAAIYGGNWLFNLALRHETSPLPKYEKGNLAEKDTQSEMFGSVQYSLFNPVVLGLSYNYFLLRELSIALTIFL